MNIFFLLNKLFQKSKNCVHNHVSTFFIVIFFSFVLLGPLVINKIFYMPAPFPILNVHWELSDALSYYGTILSSIASIIGVYLSISAAQKNYHEDEINKVKPYLSITSYRRSYNIWLFDRSQAKNSSPQVNECSSYKEYILDKVCFTIENQNIRFQKDLSDVDKKIVESNGLSLEEQGHYIYLSLMIENIGNGAATNMRIGFYRENSERLGVDFYTFKVNQCAYCMIFSKDSEKNLFGNYVLDLSYGDILGHRYSQKYPLEIDKQDKYYRIKFDLKGLQAPDVNWVN